MIEFKIGIIAGSVGKKTGDFHTILNDIQIEYDLILGPVSVHEQNGVVDYVADNEEDATLIAKKLLAYFQGPINEFSVKDQEILRNIMPEDRRYTYEIRDIINTVADEDSFLELKKNYGQSIVGVSGSAPNWIKMQLPLVWDVQYLRMIIKIKTNLVLIIYR